MQGGSQGGVPASNGSCLKSLSGVLALTLSPVALGGSFVFEMTSSKRGDGNGLIRTGSSLQILCS